MKQIFNNLPEQIIHGREPQNSVGAGQTQSETVKRLSKRSPQVRQTRNGFADFLMLYAELQTVREAWKNLPSVRKLPLEGYRLVSLRPRSDGYCLTVFVDNGAVENKIKNLTPSLLNELSKWSISQISIKISKNQQLW